MATEIGSYDAKSRLPELLRQVRQGRRFTITHRGKPVAELVPVGSVAAGRNDEAVDAMLRFPRITGVGADDVAAWIAEGRR